MSCVKKEINFEFVSPKVTSYSYISKFAILALRKGASCDNSPCDYGFF